MLTTVKNSTDEEAALPIRDLFGIWQPIASAPRDEKSGKFLVTNNLHSRDAFGNMDHLWLVSRVHDEGWQVTAFDGDRWNKVQNLTHWMSLSTVRNLPPAQKK